MLLGVADDPEGCDAKLLVDVTELDWTLFHRFDGAAGSVGMGVERRAPMTPGAAAGCDEEYVAAVPVCSPTGFGVGRALECATISMARWRGG